MTDVNAAIASMVGSASFLLTAVALLLTAIAIAFTAWANMRAKHSELETKRLELSYRFLLAASGGGDARLCKEDHYSSVEIQTMSIAALRSFPEYRAIYERLLAERTRVADASPDNVYNQVLKRETEMLLRELTTVQQGKSSRR